jgi:hypothetical protein
MRCSSCSQQGASTLCGLPVHAHVSIADSRSPT